MPAPSEYIDWVTTGNPAYIVEPTAEQKNTGWVFEEAPPFEYMNWLFYLLDQWIKWLDPQDQKDTATLLAFYQGVIGGTPGAYKVPNYASFTAANTGATAGDRLLVIGDISLGASSQTLNKANLSIEFLPGKTISGSGTGLVLGASGIRIRGGRFSGFTTAININNGSQNCIVTENRFATCTTDINDANTTPNNITANNLTEV